MPYLQWKIIGSLHFKKKREEVAEWINYLPLKVGHQNSRPKLTWLIDYPIKIMKGPHYESISLIDQNISTSHSFFLYWSVSFSNIFMSFENIPFYAGRREKIIFQNKKVQLLQQGSSQFWNSNKLCYKW